MNFKDMISKEFLYESKNIKEDKTSSKIIYKFDINIKKIEDTQSETPPVDNTAAPAPADTAAAPVDLSMPQGTAAPVDTSTMPMDTGMAPVDNSAPLPADNQPAFNPSVVTEDDDKDNIEVSDDDTIIRKMEGEVIISKEDVDNIQTIEDVISKLTEEKQDGVNILDEFTSDILQVMVNPATQSQLKEKIGKESNIFTEILYGKKKEDSIGIRIIKRKNSDILTTSMMIDNKIINAPYNKDILDKKITDYRNDEYDVE